MFDVYNVLPNFFSLYEKKMLGIVSYFENLTSLRKLYLYFVCDATFISLIWDTSDLNKKKVKR